jgi:hypothetical protein
MPNWCVNQVDIAGDEAEVAKLIELVKGEDDAFDFSNIVPIPDSPYYAANEGQNDFLCGCKPEFITTKLGVEGAEGHEWEKEYGFQPREGYWAVDGVAIKKVNLDNGTIEDSVSQMFGGSEVCPKHDLPKISSQPDWWYNWNVANWGTKWNCLEVWHDRADDSVIDGKTSYNFDTAWSPAEPVIAALAKQFPTLSITHRYCEGGMGYAGEVEYANGVESERNEYGSGDDGFPEEAWIAEEDGRRGYERDYDAVPQTEFEAFCEEHFGGVVGG